MRTNMKQKYAVTAERLPTQNAERIRKLWRVGSREVDEFCEEQAARGSKILPLTAVPIRPMPNHIIEVIRGRPPVVLVATSRGLPDLREAVCESLFLETGQHWDPRHEILITN